MSLASSDSIRRRPAFMRSASAMSSGESMVTAFSCTCASTSASQSRYYRVSVVSRASTSRQGTADRGRSAGDPIDELVDADLVGLVRDINRIKPPLGVLPEFRQVVLIVG